MRRSCELVVLALVGCGGDAEPVDLTGMYRVDAHVSSRGCMTDTPVPMPYAYVRLYAGAGYTMDVCQSQDPTSCTKLVEFPIGIEHGWRREQASSAIGGEVPVCRLQWIEGTAVRAGGSALTIETFTYADFVQPTSPQCNADEARQRGSTMDCDNHERIDATPL
jgi:hypothetical protein